MKRLPALLALAAAAAATARAEPIDHLYAFTAYVRGIESGVELAGFPVLVRLAEGSPAGFSYADCAPDGADLHFADIDGNDIPCDVDTWNPDGESLVWVRLPAATHTTRFEMRYGGGAAPPLAASATWADYDGVWHMDSAHPEDSTAHGYDGEPSTEEIEPGPGPVGAALRFPGTGQVATDPTPNAPLAQGFSIESWALFERTSTSAAVARNDFMALKGNVPNLNLTTPGIKDHNQGASPGVPAGEWVHLGVTFDPEAAGGCLFYVNGELRTAQDASRLSGASSSAAYRFGDNQWGGQQLLGALDEIRVAPGVRSAEWMAAAYATVTNAEFVTFGSKRTDATDYVTVAASPATYGSAVPGLGMFTAEAGVTYVFSCPATGVDETGRRAGACLGWNLYRAGEAAPFRRSTDAGETALSCTVAYSEPVRLEWLWGEARGRGWLHDAAAGTLTELDPPGGGAPWILRCSGSGGELAVKSVAQNGTNAVVDLALPVADASGAARAVVELGIDAFKGNAALEEIRLPDTLRTIRRGVFDGCPALRRVDPLLPDSVTAVGVEAFRNAPVRGSLRIGFGDSFAYLPDDRGWNGTQYFAGTKIEEIVFGPAVPAVGACFASNDKALTNVVFQTTNLATVASEAFLGCAKLRRAEPLLPDTVSHIGSRAFEGTAVEGTLRLGHGGPTTIGTEHYSQGRQFWGAGLREIDLGPGVPSIPAYFATDCKSLTNLVLQTTNLASVGQEAFSGCTALRRVDPLLPDTVTTLAAAAFYGAPVEGSLRIGFGGPTTLGSEYYSEGRQFWGAALSDAAFGPGVTSVPVYFFSGCPALTNAVFRGTNAVALARLSFNACTALTNVVAQPVLSWASDSLQRTGSDLRCRLLFPKTSRSWDDAIAALDDFRSWTDDATDAERALYDALFPDGPTPRGYAAVGGGPKRWLVPFSESVAGAVVLTVVGEPYDVGVPSPAYTDRMEAQPPVAFSVSRYGERDGIAYESAGYRVDTMGDDYWTPGEPVEGTRAFSFDPGEEDLYRVAWLWREAGYALSVGLPSSGACSVSVSGTRLSDPELAGEYFASNAVATLVATPRAGARFVRWYGDVPAGQESAPTLTLAMDRVKSVAPYVEDVWTYDATSQTVTDGYWVLNVTGAYDSLALASVRTRPDGIGLLDLRKPTDGCVFAAIGTDLLKGRTDIEEVRLPDTLRRIGRGAFDGCTALRRVVPLLPDSVAEIGVEAFRNAPVEGALRLGFGESFSFLADDRGWNGNQYFQNTRIEDLALGPAVTALPWNVFEGCTALTNADLGAATSLASIGLRAFGGCTALRRVEPLLPDSVSSIGAQAFSYAPVEGTLRLGFGGPVDLRDDERGWNSEHHFEYTRIGEVVLGPGVTEIKRGFILSDTALSNVVFRTTALRSIGYGAFRNCSSLRRVEPLLPDTVVRLNGQAFEGTQVEGPLRLGFGGPMDICADAWSQGRQFWGTRITEIVAGPGVTNVPPYFARECALLTNVVFRFPTLEALQYNAFQLDAALEQVTFRTFPAFGGNVFEGVPSTARFFVPDDVPAWQAWLDDPANATPWAELSDDARAAYFERWPVRPSRPKWRAVQTRAPFPRDSWILRYVANEPTLLYLK